MGVRGQRSGRYQWEVRVWTRCGNGLETGQSRRDVFFVIPEIIDDKWRISYEFRLIKRRIDSDDQEEAKAKTNCGK